MLSSRLRWLAGFLILAWFVLVSKAAYQASFSDDDLFNVALTYVMNAREWAEYLLSPRLSLDNLRPVGLLYYAALGRASGLHYGPYVLALQVLHLGVTFLLWRWLRPLGFWPATAGALLFAGYAATLAAYWKSMYVFDVLCALFTMAALLAYRRGRWIWALAAFWLAYKAKEAAIALPAVLTLYEANYIVDNKEKNWVRLVFFWAVSLSFGLQALLQPHRPNQDYTMHLSAAVVLTCAAFYAGKVLFFPYSGFVISALPAFVRRREVLFGVASFWIMLAPMLVFPGRLQSAYLYVPSLFLMMAIAGIGIDYPRALAAVVLLWLPVDYLQIREARKPILALGHEHRPYIEQVSATVTKLPPAAALLYDGAPPTLGNWGIDGLFRLAAHNARLPVYAATSREGRKLLTRPDVPLLHWNWLTHRLFLEQRAERPLAYIDFATQDPLWQLDGNWYAVDGPCRWTREYAAVTLGMPAGAARFRITLNVAKGQSGLLRVRAADRELLAISLDSPGWYRYATPPMEPVERVELRADEPFTPGGEKLGALVCEIGYEP